MHTLNLIGTSLLMLIAAIVTWYMFEIVISLFSYRQTGMMAGLAILSENLLLAGLFSMITGGVLLWLIASRKLP